MAEFDTETIILSTETDAVVNNVPANYIPAYSRNLQNLIYFIFGTIEVLLLFRLFFKFTGAGATGAFVRTIYEITNLFVLPFNGIFPREFNEGVVTTSVFEPSTLIALVTFAILAMAIVKIIGVLSQQGMILRTKSNSL